MMTLLGSIAAAMCNWLLGRFFPSHPQVTPEVIAQAQKDRADVLQSQKDARANAISLRADVDNSVHTGSDSSGPGSGVYTHDANELPPE